MQKNLWNSLALNMKGYHLHEDIAKYKRESEIRLIKSWCKKPEKKNVLKTDLWEEAFGGDYVLDYLMKNFRKCYAMDVSDIAIRKAKERFRNNAKQAVYRCGDIRDIPFRDDFFDVVFSMSTIDQIETSEIDYALRELKRILKPGGALILGIDNRENINYHFWFQISRIFGLSAFPLVKCYSMKEMRDLADKCKLEIEDYTSIVKVPPPVNWIMKKTRLLPFNRKLCSGIISVSENFIPDNVKTGWLLVLKISKRTNTFTDLEKN